MSDTPLCDEIPPEIDFSKGVRGLHHIKVGDRVFVPTSVEREVWEYFFDKAEQKGVQLPELLSEILRRDMESAEP